MLKKLLKYDIRSMSGYWWIIAVSTFGASVVGAIALRLGLETINSQSFGILSSLSMSLGFLSIIAVCASISVTTVLVHYRLYKNFFTDEGYLTFTLPATRSAHLLSKTLNAAIWLFAHYLLLFICAFVYVLISPASDQLFTLEAFEKIAQTFSLAFEGMGFFAPIFILETILAFALSGVFSIVLVNFCITIGAIVAKKHKILASIGIYYLVNIILTVVVQFFLITGIITSLEGFSNIMSSLDSEAAMNAALAILFMIAILMMATVCVTLYLLTLEKLERKLNLE